MTTIRQLISGSLRLLNVIQQNEVATNDDMTISLKALDQMLDSWSADKLSVYLIKQYYFPLVVNKKEYTLGPGGDWDLTRPMQVEKMTVSYGGSLTFNNVTNLYQLVQQPNILDVPMELLTDGQYSAIPVKNQPATYPVKAYDNGNYPLRTISVWPVPTTVQPVTLWLWQPLTTYDSLDNELSFPRGYARALRFNLAMELSSEFGKTLTPDIVKIANDSYGYIKRLNNRTPVLISDVALTGGRPSVYNYGLGTTVPN